MTADVQLYEFPDDGAQIRVTVVDGEPWFYAADVCRVLGVADVSSALARLDKDDTGSTRVMSPYGTSGATRAATVKIVNESGLYDLILSSRKPEARKFRRWVTRDVLPTIRKTGGYGATPAIPQTYAEALRLAADQSEELARVNELREIEAPKVAAYDGFLEVAGLMSVRDAGRHVREIEGLRVPERAFTQYLRLWGWIELHSTKATVKATSPGWMRNRSIVLPTGRTEFQGRFTPAGLDTVIRKLHSTVAA